MDSSLDFGDEPNDREERGKEQVWRRLRLSNALSELTSNSIRNCSDNSLDGLASMILDFLREKLINN
jgi:hypothetical protein